MKTLPRLIPLAQVLNLAVDQFYVAIINQTADKLQKSDCRTTESGQITFLDFRSWIAKLKGHETAVQTAVFVAGRFSCGPDRISAYKMAESLSERWVNSFGSDHDSEIYDKAVTTLGRISHLLNQTETEFQLNSLGISDLGDYSARPAELIVQIYARYRKLATLSASKCSELVANLGKRYGLDIDKIKNAILQVV